MGTDSIHEKYKIQNVHNDYCQVPRIMYSNLQVQHLFVQS